MTPYPELQQIIREETDDGRGIVRFLYQAMEGEFLNFTPTHQLMAGRVLGILGIEQGIEFVEANRKPRVPRNSAQRKFFDDEADAELSAAERELAGYAKRISKNGRRMIRFFLEAMDGHIKSFRPSLRIAAAKELLGYGFPLMKPASRRKQSKTAKPAPQTSPAPQQLTTQTASVAAAEPTVQTQTGHPQLCSCHVCQREAIAKYAQRHCIDHEEIYQSIIRRAMTATEDSEERVAEAARLWKEANEFVRKFCPDAEIAAFPFWFHYLMESDDEYPSGYNPELVADLYYHWHGADIDDADPDCYCDDHERDQYGRCICDICFEDEDDP